MRNKPIRDALIRGFGGLGVHTVRRTRRSDLVLLMQSLRPVGDGGRLIRVGPDGDGGYLIPDDLSGIHYGLSPGVSTESGFEAELAERGIEMLLADYSVHGPASSNERFSFDKKFIGCLEDERFTTLDRWKRDRIPEYDGDLILQMDIEGGEFEALMSLSMELLMRFRIMVIEFHYLHQLWNKPWFLLVSRVFEKLLKTHRVVHIHPNNCCGWLSSRGLVIPRVMEFSFHRNDRLSSMDFRDDFPHPLDRDNTGKEMLPLPGCWYKDP